MVVKELSALSGQQNPTIVLTREDTGILWRALLMLEDATLEAAFGKHDEKVAAEEQLFHVRRVMHKLYELYE